MLEEHGALDNLRRVVGGDAPRRGMRFSDSDVHKTLEAVAWELGREHDDELRAWFDDTVALLEAVQDDDGYLDSFFQSADAPRERWSWFEHGHELYCLGHLVQAAIAARRALGDRSLLAVALRFVDHAEARFGGEQSSVVCGHPEIETALVELFRLTGDERHLRFATRLVDRRGRGFLDDPAMGARYFQDDVPARDAHIMRGHAVRALYLAAGTVDVALETGDEPLLESARRQWDDLVARRMHVTGGAGSRHSDEAFGDAFELPADRAYAETCAGVALVQWAWRMHLATGEARFLDVLETALWNAVAVGVDGAGTRFRYSNPLQVRPDGAAATSRQPWFECACCPPNLARLVASIEHCLASTDGETIFVSTLASMRVDLDGATLEVTTDAPRDGTVRLRAHGALPVVAVRVPAWASDVRVEVDDRAVEPRVDAGWLRLPGGFGEAVVRIALEPRVLAPHPRADALRGSVAVARGSIVYCLEQRDNDVDVDAAELVGGVRARGADDATWLGPVLRARAAVDVRDPDALPLYDERPQARGERESARLTLRPYATWGEGDPGAMRVWMPVAAVDPI